jgi:hypothetical protein
MHSLPRAVPRVWQLCLETNLTIAVHLGGNG